MIELNRVYNENCVDTMARMDEESVDLIVTSPPYDDIRKYNGYSFDIDGVIAGIKRVLKDGHVCVWVVGDATVNGSETGTSFRQALKFMDAGMLLHDTMIYEKCTSAFPARRDSKRYTQLFEYMFVFVKGGRIRDDIELLCDKRNTSECSYGKLNYYDKNGLVEARDPKKKVIVPEFSIRNNIWRYLNNHNEHLGHPAVFPDRLAEDHIRSWSLEGELVYDPFMGSGTTAKMAVVNHRQWIGSEISREYCGIIERRLGELQTNLL